MIGCRNLSLTAPEPTPDPTSGGRVNLAPWPLARRLAFAASFGIAVLAVADARGIEGEDVFSYFVGGGLSYDNNLLRLPNGFSPSDVGVGDRPRGSWIINAFARVALDAPISRQRIRGYVQPNAYRYDDYSYLNWQGVDFGASWLWEAGNRWNGTVSYDHTKFLSAPADLRALIQNLRTVQIARANAEYWLHPRWRLTGGYTGTFISNSSEVIATTNVNENAFGAGFKFVSTQQNSVIFGVRYTDGDYPNRSQPTIIGDTGFTQYDVGIDLSWRLGGRPRSSATSPTRGASSRISPSGTSTARQGTSASTGGPPTRAGSPRSCSGRSATSTTSRRTTS